MSCLDVDSLGLVFPDDIGIGIDDPEYVEYELLRELHQAAVGANEGHSGRLHLIRALASRPAGELLDSLQR